MFFLYIAIFAICNAFSEIVAKKYMNNNKVCGEWRLAFWLSLMASLVSIFIYLFGINEYYSNPVETLLDYPLISVQFILFALSFILPYKALKTIEVSKESTILYGNSFINTIGMIIFGGIIGSSEILAEYITLPITLTLFICFGGFILLLALTFSAKEPDNKPDYAQTLGIMLCLFAACFDGIKTIMDDNIMGLNSLNSFDYIGAFYSLGLFGMILSWVIVTIKEKKIYNPFEIKNDKDALISNGLLAIGGLGFYSAFSLNSEWSSLGTSLVPILVILFARKFLLEKLKSEEYIALIIIIISVTLLAVEQAGLIA